MKNLTLLICGLLIFIAGLIIGNILNNKGQYQSPELTYTTDTKNGILYILRSDDIIKIDIKTGEKKYIKIKEKP